MSYSFYKFIHIIGIFLSFSALGSIFGWVATGGEKAANPSKKFAASLHGVGLLILLVSGFGMLAKAKLGFPTWIIGKLIVWLLLGASIAFIYKKKESYKFMWLVVLALGATAASLAIFKWL